MKKNFYPTTLTDDSFIIVLNAFLRRYIVLFDTQLILPNTLMKFRALCKNILILVCRETIEFSLQFDFATKLFHQITSRNFGQFRSSITQILRATSIYNVGRIDKSRMYVYCMYLLGVRVLSIMYELTSQLGNMHHAQVR